uniref:Uncharacterized protein n=1 Tax=Candidatus Kentrum sp. LPFa TaxID=2126335 RepID=A0A450XLN0_9GAMM|nr:MAG: hypothetical protein BECKLPF1236A_GA0070988_101025 [Candidatus Kentron sp. LPFa]VFK30068.1 MAG: hypothetical protein BECKLPF1236C_GA0070990_1010112 [Candidatus Kentron sp. LPFa]
MLITFDFGGASLCHEILHFVQKSLSSYARTMRGKSVENLKTKVRAKACTITMRSHNLDDDPITQVNRIARGTANYFTENKTLANRRTGAHRPV